jgi:hypothetical protein
MAKKSSTDYFKSTEYLDAEVEVNCDVCKMPVKTTHRKLTAKFEAGEISYCAECSARRLENPAFFDWIVRLIESKSGEVMNEIGRHERNYKHDSYDY